jgi:hypothetical protein
MDNDMIKSMFTRARDQYEGAVRLSFILVFACLLFHTVNFSQFVRLNRQLVQAEAELNRLNGLSKQVSTLTDDLQQAEKETVSILEKRLEVAQAKMVSDFDSLDSAIAGIRTPVTEDFTSAGIDALLESDLSATGVLQSGPIQVQAASSSFYLDENVRQGINNARNNDQLRQVVLPVIEQQIIQPRFEELNVYWVNEAAPQLIETCNAALVVIDEKADSFPEGAALWEQARANLKQTIQVVSVLSFQPPTDDPEWWTTVGGKLAVLEGIRRAASHQLSAVSGLEPIEELNQRIAAITTEQENLQTALKQELDEIEQSFADQQTKLASLGKPFEFVSLDLAFVVSMFPLLLGIILATATVWPAYRLRELAWAVDLMVDRSKDKALQDWFYARTWFYLPRPSKPAKSAQQPGRSERWAWKYGGIGRSLLFLAWIVIPTWQLVGYGGFAVRPTVFVALGGGLAILVAETYRWLVARDIQKSGVKSRVPEQSGEAQT